jgi:gas vesicle protein
MKRGDNMQRGFAKGLVVGSLIGASVSMMGNSGIMKSRTRRKLMKTGRNLFRKSGDIFTDVIQLFR